MTTDLLIVGRGPSSHGFSDWDQYGDVMALSSGIYSIPEDARPPKHFCTLDRVKWFLAPIHDETAPDDYPFSWQDDENAHQWAFWSDHRIRKHVPDGAAAPGRARILPGDLYDVIPEFARESFSRGVLDHWHLFGFQPSWGDYPNVCGWKIGKHLPTFDGRSIGLKASDEPDEEKNIRNSWFMAVQVAYRLGYRRLFFVGNDFRAAHYASYAPWLTLAYERAAEAGMEWVSLSTDSLLNEIITPCRT